MKKTLLEAAHEMAKDLYEAGVIDAETMREYEAVCIPEVSQAEHSSSARR